MFKVSSPCRTRAPVGLQIPNLGTDRANSGDQRKNPPRSGPILANCIQLQVIERIKGAKVKPVIHQRQPSPMQVYPIFTWQLRKTGTVRGRASALMQSVKFCGTSYVP
jgi:hypothetical protein